MGFNHENVDQFMVELLKHKGASKEELEILANRYLTNNSSDDISEKAI